MHGFGVIPRNSRMKQEHQFDNFISDSFSTETSLGQDVVSFSTGMSCLTKSGLIAAKVQVRLVWVESFD